ncbi:MAG: 2-hydroxy-acid oxidase, partial [Bacillaceae bacterium G1]
MVVFPKSREEVSAILAYANEHRIPVIPFGMGTSLEGHVIPVRGGISLDLSMMNEILEIRPQDFLVRVQPGVTRQQLNQRLKTTGLYFPIDPGADASLGGMAATNASGTSTVRYGMMRNQVLGMEVVLADGSIIRTGGMTFKSSSGYDLRGLFIGSEGTLGVITELTLKLYAVPEKIIAARAVFADVETAGTVAFDMMRSGLSVGRLELVDKRTIEAVNRYKNTRFPENHTLFLEFSGSANAVQSDVELAKDIAAEYGCLSFDFEKDETARAKLWEARHQAAMAIAAAAPQKRLMITDVCV